MRRRWLTSLALLASLFVGSANAQQTTGTTTSSTTGGTGSTTTSSIGGSSGFGSGSSGFGSGSSGFGGGGTGGQGLGSTQLTTGGLLSQSSLAGGTTGGTAGTSAIGGTSFLGANYGYPMAKGLPTNSIVGGATATTTAFGQPLYTVNGTGTTGTGTTGGRGTTGGTRLGGTGTGGFGTTLGGTGTASVSTGQAAWANSAGMVRTMPYVTELGFQPNLAPPAVVGQQVQTVFSSSTRLNNAGVQVTAQGDTMVLRGQAADPRQRLVIEAMARMSPGVRGVQNEIVTPGGGLGR